LPARLNGPLAPFGECHIRRAELRYLRADGVDCSLSGTFRNSIYKHPRQPGVRIRSQQGIDISG
jgi:hypothetical protein